jgi:hypothetical protein
VFLVAAGIWMFGYWPGKEQQNNQNGSFFSVIQNLEPILEGERDSARFVFQLNNPSPVKFENLCITSKSCSCVDIRLEKLELGPGHSTNLVLVTSLRGVAGLRAVSCIVDGKGSDGRDYRWACQGTIDVLSRFAIEPSNIVFDDCLADGHLC